MKEMFYFFAKRLKAIYPVAGKRPINTNLLKVLQK